MFLIPEPLFRRSINIAAIERCRSKPSQAASSEGTTRKAGAKRSDENAIRAEPPYIGRPSEKAHGNTAKGGGGPVLTQVS